MTPRLSFSFLRRRRHQIVTMILLLQAVALYSLSFDEAVPVIPPLRRIADQFDRWQLLQEVSIEEEALSILSPDDYLMRDYVDSGTRQVANLFIAYFRTQRSERMPHSPKNCLPGNGWLPLSYSTISIAVPGQAKPVEANSYVAQKGSERAVVLYWYQSWNRTTANEYAARFYLALDSIRHRRTDTALVRVIVPVPEDGNITDFQKAAVDFVRDAYPQLHPYFPAS